MTSKSGGHLWLVDWSYDEDDDTFDWLDCQVEGFEAWRVRIVVSRTEHGLSLDKLSIEPTGAEVPPGGIPTTLLRSVRTRDLYQAARIAGMQAGWYTRRSGYVSALRRPGRAGQPDLIYARWAKAYVDELPSGRPIAELARKRHLSESQVRNYVSAARRRGLLTATTRGRLGGELTNRALDVLKEGGRHG